MLAVLTACLATLFLHHVNAETPAAYARRIPPRGYNPCNGLQCNMGLLGEPALRALASSISSNGMAAANYTWVNLDDGIVTHRAPDGTLVADTSAFPSGTLLPLAQYVNSLGLQLGAYTDRGTSTCENRPGALGHEAQDAKTWASWGVRWLKEDSCASSVDITDAAVEYSAMRDGLKASGEDVFFSLCGWFSGFASFSTLTPTIGDTWRVSTDVPNLERFLQNIEAAAAASDFTGPNKGWPDVDMIGGHWSAPEETLHVAFIATIGAPLLLSWNISNPNDSTLPLSTYLNPELLAIHSDDPASAVASKGHYYSRISGGAVTGPATAQNVGVPLDTSLQCTDPLAQFTWRQQGAGGWGSFESQGLPGLCIGYWDLWGGACIDAAAVQLTPCNSTANGCGRGAQLFNFNATSGTLLGNLTWGGGTPLATPFLTHVGGVPGALYVQSLQPSASQGAPPEVQSWKLTAPGPPSTTTTIQNTVTGECLGSPSVGATNVWARWLSGGDVALLFFNVGKAPSDVTCDSACLKMALGNGGGTWVARDVMGRKTWGGDITVVGGVTVPALDAQGGTLLLRLSPK